MGIDVFFRGIKEGIKKNTPKYSLSLYELIKSYADFKKKNFSSINIKKLKTYTMEEAIKVTSMFDKLKDWCDLNDLIPYTFRMKKIRRTGYAGSSLQV